MNNIKNDKIIRKKIVIVGGGFAGLSAAKILGKESHSLDLDLDILLIDQRNHHLFQPLLYQVAMAALGPSEIAIPIRSVLSKYKNCDVLMGKVISVDLIENKIITEFSEIHYDYLILACGANHSYFGHDEWEEFAPGLKNIEQASEIKRRVLQAFELAERETNLEIQKQLQSFIIVGGGPTGVELAGALGEMSRYTLIKDFHCIDSSKTRIILIEGGPRILGSFSPELSNKAARDLESLGVTIWTNSQVTSITKEGVFVGKSEFIKASTVLWAAGIKPSFLNQTLQGVELDLQGRVIVQPSLNLKNYNNVFVVGDQAHAKGKDGKNLPGLAPVAIQQGAYVAKKIIALENKKEEKREIGPFYYVDKGQMATIGKKRAVVQTKYFKFGGFFAWITWLVVHIYYLIGFKNRVFVLFQWAWSYFTSKRGARLIINQEWKEK